MTLFEYRKLLCVSRAEAARQCGVDPVTYWRHETGKATPRLEHVRKYRDWSKGAITADDFAAYAQGGDNE